MLNEELAVLIRWLRRLIVFSVAMYAGYWLLMFVLVIMGR